MADLRGADLSMANLQGAHLRRVNLYRADLSRTKLRNTDLHRVNLNRVRNLTYEHLAQAKRLCRATMPDGCRYDGRLNLEGDIAFARAGGINPEVDEEMAAFYGVSVEEYGRGQKWAETFAAGIQEKQQDIEWVVVGRELRKVA
jgi:uncharacterized protein YjbI with pentapeptide repeats